jgi:endoglucanase
MNSPLIGETNHRRKPSSTAAFSTAFWQTALCQLVLKIFACEMTQWSFAVAIATNLRDTLERSCTCRALARDRPCKISSGAQSTIMSGTILNKARAITAMLFGVYVLGGPVIAGDSPRPSSETMDYNRLLGAGINLGNALDAGDAPWAIKLQGDYFDEIKSAGFSSIRIPIAWNTHVDSSPPYTIDSHFLKKVDWTVNETLSRGLTAVIDVHHDVDMEREPEQYLPRLKALWSQIAEHFQSYPDRLFFELFNEPSGALSDDRWQRILLELIRVVRATNPNRILVIGPGYWNSVDHLINLQLPPEDRKIIVTIHYYSPMQFTHQGANWVHGSEKWKGTTWRGSPEQLAQIDRDFDKASSWAKSDNRPLFVGEFGAFEGADMDSRARWTRAVVEAANKRGFSWAYWEFCSNFGAFDPVANKWREPLLDALLPNRGK